MDAVTKNVTKYFNCMELDKFEAVEDEEELVTKGMDLIRSNKLWAGLVFLDMEDSGEKLPKFVSYKIRLDADKVDSTKRLEDRLSIRGSRRRPGIDLKYLYYGFAYLQDMVEHAIISIQTGRNMSSLPGVTLQQMPYPCYIEDRFIIAIARTFPLFMTLAWVRRSADITVGFTQPESLTL